MPGWDRRAGGLLPEEITAVADYLRAGAPATPVPSVPTLRGSLESGRDLFFRNCAGCHGMDGRGGIAPEIGNPVFQKAATDEFIVRTIRLGRQNTAMPAFQRPDAPALSDQDIADVLAFLRSWRTKAEPKALAQSTATSSASRGKP